MLKAPTSPARALMLASALLLARPVAAQFPSGITFAPAFGSAGSGAFGKLAGMEEIPGKAGHFLVSEISGKIWLLTPGASGHTRSLFATIAVRTNDEDQGLHPLAFHPDFATNRKYYVRYGDPSVPQRRFRLDEREFAADGLRDAGKVRMLLTGDQPSEFADHNGGGIIFGRDGYLYLGLGDGGWDLKTPDVHNHGQNRESLLGKILRLDVNRKDPGLEYGIPADNPFVNDANPRVRREIFAWGLRNPYRMSMDRLTGDIYVADIGLFNFEKVYILKKGANYGWKLQEHTLCYTPGTCNAITVEPAAGFLAYGQVKCFIGGHVYRGNPASPFYGAYLFGDYTMKRLLAFKKGSAPVQVSDLQSTPVDMLGFTLDSQNVLYMIGYRGNIYKLEHKDLQPGATALRPAPRPRLSIFPRGSSRPGARAYALDGTRVRNADGPGPAAGLDPALPAGLYFTAP